MYVLHNIFVTLRVLFEEKYTLVLYKPTPGVLWYFGTTVYANVSLWRASTIDFRLEFL